MRIGFDAKRAFHNRTGLGNYSRWVVEELERAYPQEEYVLYNPSPGLAWSGKDRSSLERLPRGLWKWAPSAWRRWGMARQFEADGIELFHGLSNELPASIESRIASVVSIHDLIFERFPQWYKPADRLTYRLKFKAAALRADRVFALSEQTRQDLIDFYRVDPHKIELHYQSCHRDFQLPAEQLSQSRIEAKTSLCALGFPEDFALYVGTVEPRKNLLSLLKALRDLDLPLVVVGAGGTYKRECLEFVRKHGMEHRIQWFENLPKGRLPQLYRAALVFIYPSIFEGFGIPILEALFSGCPVITSQGGVFPETAGPHSLLVDPMSEDSLRAALVRLTSDSGLRDQMRRLGNRYAFERFEPEARMADLHRSYQNILSLR